MSVALHLLATGGVRFSWRRSHRVYIYDGLDAVTWLANKTPFKREKSLANSAKTSGTLTLFQKLQHLCNHCANSSVKTKISAETTQLSIGRPKWRMTCAEVQKHQLQ